MSTLADIVETTGNGVHATRADAMLIDAVAEMCRWHVRALLVGDLVDPIGILSERDVLERAILGGRNPSTTPVDAVMTTPLISLPVDWSLGEALDFMRAHHVHQVPIVSEEAVVGIVSATDLMRWATRDQEFQIRALTDYCGGGYVG